MKKEKKEMVGSNAVTQAEIDNWKAEFGHVYRTESAGKAFIFRPIRRSEYTKLMLDTDINPEEEVTSERRLKRLSDRQLGICKICVLWPQSDVLNDMLEGAAGLALNLSEEIMDCSGFNALSGTQEL